MVFLFVCLLSLSDSLLLVYGNATNFCILILYPATLLNSFVSFNSFLVESLAFSIYSIYLQIVTVLLLPFLIWMHFISFSCLISLARASNTMLNKSGKSGHPCLVPDLRGNAFSFSPLKMMFAVGLSYMGYLIYFHR